MGFVRGLLFSITIFSSSLLWAEDGVDNLLCGGTFNQQKLEFRFNPIGGKFHYSATSPDEYLSVYVKYDSTKNDRLEVVTIEFMPDNAYEKFKKVAADIPEIQYLQKNKIQKQTASLYKGFWDYRVEQGENITTISCTKKSQEAPEASPAPDKQPSAPKDQKQWKVPPKGDAIDI